MAMLEVEEVNEEKHDIMIDMETLQEEMHVLRAKNEGLRTENHALYNKVRSSEIQWQELRTVLRRMQDGDLTPMDLAAVTSTKHPAKTATRLAHVQVDDDDLGDQSNMYRHTNGHSLHLDGDGGGGTDISDGVYC